MERPNLEALLEKVRAIAHGPQADLLSKFVDLLYKSVEKWERQGQATQAGRQLGGYVARSRAYR